MTDDLDSLGSLIRTWRERLSPADVGLVPYGVRRTKGLRREELAQLARVSVDYVIRLEQGRSRTPSAPIVASLARTLQLGRTETALLYRAAGLTPPASGSVSQHIPAGVQRMITRMADLPLAVFAADWTLLTSTPLWHGLFGSTGAAEPGQNLVVHTFIEGTISGIATAEGGAEAFERSLVADLRRSAADLQGDASFAELIADLRSRSPRFDAYWAEGSAAPHQTLVKTIHHPLVGDIRLDCDVLTVPDSDVKLVVYSTLETGPDAEKLQFLRVSAVHTQFTD